MQAPWQCHSLQPDGVNEANVSSEPHVHGATALPPDEMEPEGQGVQTPAVFL